MLQCNLELRGRINTGLSVREIMTINICFLPLSWLKKEKTLLSQNISSQSVIIVFYSVFSFLLKCNFYDIFNYKHKHLILFYLRLKNRFNG